MSDASQTTRHDPQAHLMQSLIRKLACSLVKDIHQVKVAVGYEGDSTVFTLNVSTRDISEHLPGEGKAARSIESIVHAGGVKVDRRFVLRVQGVHGPQLVSKNSRREGSSS